MTCCSVIRLKKEHRSIGSGSAFPAIESIKRMGRRAPRGGLAAPMREREEAMRELRSVWTRLAKAVVSVALALSPAAAAAATVVDQDLAWNSFYISTVGATQSDFYAQSFVPDVTSITRFGVVLGENTPEGQVLLAICRDNGAGRPDLAAPLYQGALLNPTPTMAWFYEEGLSVPVTPGLKYWIVIDGYNNAGATGNSKVGTSAGHTNTGENMIYTNDAGTTWGQVPFAIALHVEGTAPAPIFSSLSPSSGPWNSGGNVTLLGDHLGHATSVTFGGLPVRITATTTTSVTVVTSPHVAGTVDVEVTTPGGTARLAAAYAYTDVQIPTLSGGMLALLAAALACAGAFLLRR